MTRIADIERGDDPRDDYRKIQEANAQHARERLTRLSTAIAAVIEQTAKAGARVPRSVRTAVDDLNLVMVELLDQLKQQ